MLRKLALCAGRHSIPEAEGSVFSNTLNPLDISAMDAEAARVLEGTSDLVLYVTGLTVALVSVINYCHANSVKLTLMHFDRTTGEYYPQVVL